ncbi:hypothetical protein LQZ18_01595 [Lachnospiraceae bacterium ZAX-1]
MFTGMINLSPGREIREFEVFRTEARKNQSGRVMSNGNEKIGTIWAILAATKPEEKERWRQLEHPITHKIIQQGAAPFEITSGDYFERGNKRYLVQTAPYNVGDLNHWTIYYCNERSDA